MQNLDDNLWLVTFVVNDTPLCFNKTAFSCLLLLGLDFLGQNIYFTNNPYPYWWRGVSADGSILFLTTGVLLFFILPAREKMLSIMAIVAGILLIFASIRAILKPTSLWQFVLSLASFYAGSELLTKGRLRL